MEKDIAAQKLIIALDVPTTNDALNLVEKTKTYCATYKVGLELFIGEGPKVIEEVLAKNVEIFLDLKLHDIPNTMKGAVLSACKLGVSWLTVHSLCGKRALAQAQEALSRQKASEKTKLLAVSVLTHHSDQELIELGFAESPERLALRLLKGALACGITACICSPKEAAIIRDNFGDDLTIICPGVRPKGANKIDQKRVMEPGEAILAGANKLVIGRPITKAKDPELAAHSIHQQIKLAIAGPKKLELGALNA